jgi:hypothetical protein
MKIAELKDGQHRQWEMEMVARYPLALSEMRWPSVPLNKPLTEPLARWDSKSTPVGARSWSGCWRGSKQRSPRNRSATGTGAGSFSSRKSSDGSRSTWTERATPEMRAAITHAAEESGVTCEVCGSPGRLAERHGWWATRCAAHKTWSPHDESH